jgi:hypothetical protein
MTNYARVINNVAVDVCTDPASSFHPIIAAEFEPVPAEVRQGWVRTDGVWSAPEPTPQPEPVAPAIIVTPIQFQLLFTSAERIAIKHARATDEIIDDFCQIVEDPRLSEVNLSLGSVREGIAYLRQVGIITEDREAQILAGQIL